MTGRVVSVSASRGHGFSKAVREEIRLIAGLGVEGDAHAGATVKHRYLVKKDPSAPNRTQVHLLEAELFDELSRMGIAVVAGEMGENVTTCGIDLLALGTGTLLRLGAEAVVEVTGLRQPCFQMDRFRPGLMKACLGHEAERRIVPRAGIMGIVVAGGVVRAGDAIDAMAPEGEFRKLVMV